MGQWLFDMYGASDERKNKFEDVAWIPCSVFYSEFLSDLIPSFSLTLQILTKGMRVLFDMPCVKKHIGHEVTVQSIPSQSLKNFFLDPWSFDFSESSKYGAVGRFPSNHQYCMHFQSFVENGLEAHREAIDVKFKTSENDRGIFQVHPWSVGFVDGQKKALLVQSILGLLIHNASCCKFTQYFFQLVSTLSPIVDLGLK